MMAKLLWITSILLCASLESHLLNAQTLRLPSEKPKPLNSEYYRPLIGIVSHPGDGANGKLSRAANVSYIAASYVKFVESGGARVVPLIYNERPEILEQKFRAVNGLIFTGGSAKYGPYHQTIKKLFQRAIEENDNGEYFPVYAVCLGFEILSMIISQDLDILENFDAVNSPSTLIFENEAAKNSSIFKWFPSDILSKMSSEPIFMQNHKKNTFEWEITTIPHSPDAIQVTQSVANFVVSESRKSNHKPSFKQEEEYLIYNYSPAYSGKVGGSFDQVYLFT